MNLINSSAAKSEKKFTADEGTAQSKEIHNQLMKNKQPSSDTKSRRLINHEMPLRAEKLKQMPKKK